jgi:alpha-galactosidase
VRSTLAACCLTAAVLLTASTCEAADQSWTLKSGPVEYRLRQQADGVRLDYFGPSGLAAWTADDRRLAGYDVMGTVEGQAVLPEDLELISNKAQSPRPGVDSVVLVYRHKRLPLRLEASYSAWSDTGTLTRRLTIANTGDKPLLIEFLPELSWRLPAGAYELTYLWGGWGQERQFASEKLGAGRRTLSSNRGRSTSQYSPWFALRNTTLGVTYMAQLAWSGNWQMHFEQQPGSASTRLDQTAMLVSLGSQNDFSGALTLPAKSERALPEVAFTATAGTLDDGANQLHRYQRQFVHPKVATNDPLLVQFNSWYPFPGKMTVDEMKRCADVAAELGAEVFVLDAGWYNQKDWSTELGDYEVDRVAYPNGLEELSKHVRSRGMKFGLWVEIENVGTESAMIRQHPDWLLAYNGKPVLKDARAMLNFAKPEVREWAHATVDRLVKDYDLEWMKIDYNIDVGDQFDPAATGQRRGTVLADHIASYYAWLDEVRRRHPKLVIENCSSGGLRFDLGILAHTHTNWLSDVVAPLPSVQLAWGCTMEFLPEMCNHWMVGEGEGDGASVDNNAPPGWWDFLFRVPMNGQFGISSRVFDWSPSLRQRAAENVALYKRIRTVIQGSDVYHLTPSPSHQDPQGWMALQYVSGDRTRSVLMAYRLRGSKPERHWKLRGLDPAAWYRITIDGKPRPNPVSQQELAVTGLQVRLDAEWRAAVVELQAVPR